MKNRENRKQGWWWARNEIFDMWGNVLKPNGLAVYLCLCRHANHEAECWPSFSRIAKECGMHRTTVIKNIKLLESCELICSESRTTEKGDPDSNVYVILDIPSASSIESQKIIKNNNILVSENHQGSSPELLGVVAENYQGSSPELLGVVAENYQGSSPELPKGNTLKETHLKETHLRNTTTRISNLGGTSETNFNDSSNEIENRHKKTAIPSATNKIPEKDSGLIFDFALRSFNPKQKKLISHMLKGIKNAQDVLDQFNFSLLQKKVKEPLPSLNFLNSLIERTRGGNKPFIPTHDMEKRRNNKNLTIQDSDLTKTCSICDENGLVTLQTLEGNTMTTKCIHNVVKMQKINLKKGYKIINN